MTPPAGADGAKATSAKAAKTAGAATAATAATAAKAKAPAAKAAAGSAPSSVVPPSVVPRRRARRRADAPAGILLAPGAGSNRDHPSLRAIEAAAAPLPVRRFDFAYRQAGRKAPDRPPVLLAAVQEEAAAFAERIGVGTERLLMGGRSMGGRICSIAIADGLPAAGLIAVSYPLHPPGRPDRLRTEHLPRLAVPCLFVSGTADAFGTPAELEAAFALIPGPVTTVWIDGGRHELKSKDNVVAEAVITWLATLSGRSPPRPLK